MSNIDFKQFQRKKVALVLSGGVVKGCAWHLGVAHALEDLGFVLKNNNTKPSDIEISTYVGSSAGALVSLYFASGFRPIDIIESIVDRKSDIIKPITYADMMSLKKPMKKPPKSDFYEPFDGLPFVLKNLLTPLLNFSGIFTTQGLHSYIEKYILKGNSFEDYAADLFVVSTQLDNATKGIFSKYNYPNPSHDSTSVYFTGVPVVDAVCASMAIPPFYSPYPLKNPRTGKIEYFFDGEIRETLSTHVAVDNTADFIISSWIHTPYHFHDEIGSLVNYGLPSICIQAITLMIQKKIVSFRSRRATSADIVTTVNEYMINNKFSNEHRRKIISILEIKLNYNPNVKFIDIFPASDNYRFFFSNAFSLDPKKNSDIVKMGYERTMQIFNNI